MLKNIIILGILLITSSCVTTNTKQDPLSFIKEVELKEVLSKAMDAMGGIDNWNNLKSLKFQKKIEIFDAVGTIESSTQQTHHYTFQPENKVNISWSEADSSHEMILENNIAKKTINGSIDPTAELSALKNSIYASTFVIGIPFKLLDEGAQLSYEGIEVIASGKEVHIVKAIYNPEAFDSHTKADIWWHYFDVQNYQQVGYTVQLHDHTSYIEDISFDRVGGFLFTTSRKSWRIDENGNKLYVKADYEYSDYELN